MILSLNEISLSGFLISVVILVKGEKNRKNFEVIAKKKNTIKYQFFHT